MGCVTEAMAQHDLQFDCVIPLPLSGQHGISVLQAIEAGTGVVRAIAALPNASDAIAISRRKRAVIRFSTGLTGQ